MYKSNTQYDALTRVKHEISHTTDGPITTFVLISRAIKLARDRHSIQLEDITNALYEELSDRELLSLNEYSESSSEMG